jgi:TP901 family phage tail tape measure protein
MADKSLEVKITADVTSLTVNAAVATATTRGLQSEFNKLAKQAVGASDEMRASLNPQLIQMAEELEVAKAKQAEFNEQIKVAHEVQSPFAKLSDGMESIASNFEGLTDKMQGFSKLTAAVSEFVMAGLGVEKVADSFKETAELGEKLNQMSAKTGISVEALSGLRVVAIQTGTDFDAVGQSMAKLGNTMQEAVESPTSKAAAAFREMGISVTDSSGHLRPMQDVMQQVAEKIAGYQDGTAKAALVSDLFGEKAGDMLIPLLNELGEQGFAGVTEQAQRMGVAMTKAQAEADEQFNVSLKNSGIILEGVRNNIANSLIPALTVLGQALASTAQGSSVLSTAEATVSDAMKAVVEGAMLVTSGLSEVVGVVVLLGKEWGDLITVEVAAAAAMTGNFTEARALVKTALSGMKADWDDAINHIVSTAHVGMSVDAALWGPSEKPQEAPESKPKERAPTIDKAALDAGKTDDGKKAAEEQIQIAKDAADAAKQIQQSEYQAQVSQWDAEVAQGKMTKAEEIQDEVAAQQKIYEAQLAEMEKEATLANLSKAQKAKALDDVAVYQAQHNAEMARLSEQLVAQQIQDADKLQKKQEEAAKASQQAWERAFQPITQAFDSSINGVLQGTETLKQAELKAAQSVALAFIDAEAKKLMAAAATDMQLLARHAATEMGMTAATEAGETSRLTSQAAASEAGKAISLSDAVAKIARDAATAATGAYSAVAGIPYVGPVLAPVAAATAYAGVMAFDVLSAEGGTVIPAGVNPLVQLHEKEMVLPAYISQPLMNMVDGGSINNNTSSGDTYHVKLAPNMTANGIGAGDFADQVWKALNDGIRSGVHNKYPAVGRMIRR